MARAEDASRCVRNPLGDGWCDADSYSSPLLLMRWRLADDDDEPQRVKPSIPPGTDRGAQARRGFASQGPMDALTNLSSIAGRTGLRRSVVAQPQGGHRRGRSGMARCSATAGPVARIRHKAWRGARGR